jgi:hypothetical protein
MWWCGWACAEHHRLIDEGKCNSSVKTAEIDPTAATLDEIEMRFP